MSRWIKIFSAILMVILITPVFPALAQTDADCTYSGTSSAGAKFCITMPAGAWNHDLVIFAHGYVADTGQAVAIPWDQMTFSTSQGGTVYMPDIINSLRYAFATTSYRENGLAVQSGILDILDLETIFSSKYGTPTHIYLVGASEGGLVTTLAIERNPDKFSGGMAVCGPIGSFRGQVNYWGDFRTVFDYFMDTPAVKVLPGSG